MIPLPPTERALSVEEKFLLLFEPRRLSISDMYAYHHARHLAEQELPENSTFVKWFRKEFPGKDAPPEPPKRSKLYKLMYGDPAPPPAQA